MSCRKVLVIVERYSVGMANDIWGIFGLQGRSDNVCMCVLPEIQKKKEFIFTELTWLVWQSLVSPIKWQKPTIN